MLFVFWHFDWDYLRSRLVTENALLLHEITVLLCVGDNHWEKPERSFGTVGVSRDEEPVLGQGCLHFKVVNHLLCMVLSGVIFSPHDD
jgi:hypothetical protein